MISDQLAHEILRLFAVEKWSQGAIARELRLHHSVVARVLSQTSPTPPKPQHSKLAAWLPLIEDTLAKYPTACASRIFEMAVERGHRGAPSHFRAFVAQYRPRKSTEAFIRLRTLPGEQGQVDWGHFGKVKVGRAERKLVAFVMVLSYSRRIFLRFGYDIGMAGFLDGHQRGLEHFGGVPRVLLYDNLKSAVLERVGVAIRMHPTMLNLAGHYGYEPRPVGVARGNEKGRVERSIRFIRNSFFAAREWTDLDDLNAQALAWCDGLAADRRWPEDHSRTVRDAILHEQSSLMALPADQFPCADRREVHSQKTPYVRYDLNDYSVPFRLVQRTLTVFATPGEVRVVDGQEVVAVHVRSYDKHAQIEDPAHLEGLLAHKHGAKRHRTQDRLIEAVPQTRELLVLLAGRGDGLGRAVSQMMRLLERYGMADFTEAVALAHAANTPHPNNLRLLLEKIRHRRGLPEPMLAPVVTHPRLRDLHVRPHALTDYDRLLSGKSRTPKENDHDD
ncbi:IS21 family transposase [bacterium]|nr:MAG: IS21 family transposase [bacterium]